MQRTTCTSTPAVLCTLENHGSAVVAVLLLVVIRFDFCSVFFLIELAQ